MSCRQSLDSSGRLRVAYRQHGPNWTISNRGGAYGKATLSNRVLARFDLYGARAVLSLSVCDPFDSTFLGCSRVQCSLLRDLFSRGCALFFAFNCELVPDFKSVIIHRGETQSARGARGLLSRLPFAHSRAAFPDLPRPLVLGIWRDPRGTSVGSVEQRQNECGSTQWKRWMNAPESTGADKTGY